MGPRGSGKSTGMSMEILSRCFEQKKDKHGHRRSRWAIVRNTYRELEDTTLNTWLYWVKPEYFGNFNISKMRHDITYGDVRAEILFRALDRPQDIQKLLSLELTAAWVNEAREVPFGIIEGLDDAVGRFPPKKDGGCKYRGIIMDTNPPDEDHWWYRLAEMDCPGPPWWEFFRQPGGLVEIGNEFFQNPKAENLKYLDNNYYMTRMVGKSKDHIRVYYCNQYGFVVDGKPVHPEYVDSIHCPDEDFSPVKGLTVYVGIDFGLTPAAVFGQRMPNGRWILLDELVTENMGTKRFADILGPKLRHDFAGFQFEIYGDPAGEARSQTDETTPFQILDANNIPAVPAPTNDFVLRREAVDTALGQMVDGKPRFTLSKRCKTLRKALAGGYCYKRVQVSNEERYQDKPAKNRYSHVAEATQYMMLGAGEGYALLDKPRRNAYKRMASVYQNNPQGWMVG